MTRPRAALAAALLAVALGPALGRAKEGPHEGPPAPMSVAARLATSAERAADPQIDWLVRLRTWLGAVEGHRAGSLDEQVKLIASWPPADVQAVIAEFSMLVERVASVFAQASRSGDDPVITIRDRFMSLSEAGDLLGLTAEERRRGDGNRLLLQAAQLHTDVATLVLSRPDESGSSGLLVIADGQHTGFTPPARHLDFARALLGLVRPEPARDPMVRRWYVAVAFHLERQRQLGDAERHLQRAMALFPRDADLLLAGGCLHETFAASAVQQAVASAAGAGKVPRNRISVMDEASELRQAAALFRQSLTINPSLAEAHIRLGRVLGLQGKHEEALKELALTLDSQIDDAVLRYFRALILGSEQESAGLLQDARSSYTRALELFPGAQAPRLSLSRLHRQAGERGAALAVIRPLLNASTGSAALRDPWWDYHLGPWPRPDQLLSNWRTPSAADAGRPR